MLQPAGRRDRRITVQRATESLGEFNEPVKTWGTYAILWAEKHDVSDRERLESRELASEITTRFRVLWTTASADINSKDRLIYKGVTYEIIGVKEGDARDYVEISAAARTDQ